MEPQPAFIMGMIAAAVLNWAWKAYKRRKVLRTTAPSLNGTETAEVRAQTSLLVEENGSLKALVSRAEERIAVLERIATDPATRTAREIDALRQGA